MNYQKTKSVTRKGAASFYVVIFAALVFTVIVLSFIRLMISESSQNTANDLSQSAYDSALAGIEDAKAAIAYCLDHPNGTGCDDLYSGDCSSVSNVLYGVTNNGDGEVSDAADQSYTCVKLAKDLPDYRIFLTADESTKVVRISDDVSTTQKIRISWFSAADLQSAGDKFSSGYSDNTNLLAVNSHTPPVVSVGVIEANSGDHINTVVLRPSEKSAGTNNAASPQKAYETAHDQSGDNKAAVLSCDKTGDFTCSVEIEAKSQVQYVVLSLPYREARVSFKVEKLNASGSTIGGGIGRFDSQISVDSTGRANDYYRRVESRLQLADVHFPYPDYALQASGGDGSGLKKNFWVTINCWSASGGTAQRNGAPCYDKDSGEINS